MRKTIQYIKDCLRRAKNNRRIKHYRITLYPLLTIYEREYWWGWEVISARQEAATIMDIQNFVRYETKGNVRLTLESKRGTTNP